MSDKTKTVVGQGYYLEQIGDKKFKISANSFFQVNPFTAQKIFEYVRNEISCLKWRYDVHVTASFGLGFEMPDSIKEADENMYVAKQKGKNFTAYRKDGTQYLAERRLDIREPIPDVEAD